MRHSAHLFAVIVLATLLPACGSGAPARDESATSAGTAGENTGATRPARGGQLVVSLRTEPQSFNRYVRRDSSTDLISTLINAPVVRLNRVTQEIEPWLAESWKVEDDGRTYTIILREDLRFSDGHPLTAADVVFSIDAASDPKSGSVLRDAVTVGDRPPTATAIDARTVRFELPEPYAPGLRLLSHLPVLPQHRLAAARREGRFASAWSVGTAPAKIAGAGPFVLDQYLPGQRTVLTRNPHYFRKDDQGVPLPYLDRVIVEIVPDQNGELLRLEAGSLDATASEIRPEDYAPMKRAADSGRVRLFDLGPAYDADSFWINLDPKAFAGDPRAAWLQRDELRHAISLAVDRGAFADTVYLGAAVPVWGPITPANRRWFSPALPQPPANPPEAKRLLASIGLTDRDGDGRLEDARGTDARFTLMVQKGRSAHERAAAVIRSSLSTVGLTVDVVPLDGADLVQRFAGTRRYDAVYFSILTTDTDPATNLEFWLSRGSAHIWHMEQKRPATDWERRIDTLMTEQMRTRDEGTRKAIFDEVQSIFAAHAPVLYFAAPRVFVVSSARMTGVTPALSRPQLLWAPDEVAVR